MSRSNFSFNQKEKILKEKLPLLECVNLKYGIFLCPICSQKMSLGRDKGQFGKNNYLTIHLSLGFRGFNPRKYSDVLEIHIDHINPCSNNGSNDFSNAQIICSKCNIDLSSTSNQNIKDLLTNPMAMEPDEDFWETHGVMSIYKKINNRRRINSQDFYNNNINENNCNK